MPDLRLKCVLHWKQSCAKPLLRLSCPTNGIVRCLLPHIHPRVELHCKLSDQEHAPLLRIKVHHLPHQLHPSHRSRFLWHFRKCKSVRQHPQPGHLPPSYRMDTSACKPSREIVFCTRQFNYGYKYQCREQQLLNSDVINSHDSSSRNDSPEYAIVWVCARPYWCAR